MATSLLTESRPTTRMPEKIGKYVIVNEVGRGSTGTVYLSHDPYYGRDVAIKVYNLDAGGDEEKARIARKMFLSEAHMVGMLQHPHILPIYDAGEEGDYCYIVTEHVHGARTLAAYCKPDNLLRIDDVVEIVYKCARALHYAHSRGVIHRDIKPSNIMLTQDCDVRIIDFGIALVADSDISRIEGIAGSPSYMSPEQVQSLELTHRSDIYSLGAVMYELLTGARPFKAGNLAKLLHQIVYATPAPIHTLRPDIPEELEQVCATALMKQPERRYKTGLDFAADLTRVHQKLREAVFQDRPAGAVRDAAPAAILPRVLARRDLGSDARQHLARLRARRADRPRRRDRRPLLHPRVRRMRGRAQRHQRRQDRDRRLLRRDRLREGCAAHRQHPCRRAVTVLKVSATLLEQVSAACQLRFNRMFLKTLITRLQNAEALAIR